MFKTLVAAVDNRLVVGVVPVSGRLDLKALALAAGGKRAELVDQATAERATGYVVGGISPLGQRLRLATVIDRSAADQVSVLVSAGRRGLDVELAAADLVALTGAPGRHQPRLAGRARWRTSVEGVDRDDDGGCR